jgi:hypothetical protein
MSMSVKDVVGNIDWAMLRGQKACIASILVEAAAEGHIARVEHLDGLMHLIDNIQDAAVDEGVATVKEVFDLEEEF